MVQFLGHEFNNSSLLSYSLFFIFDSGFNVSILSGIADYTGNKKRFLQFFVI
jgi:UMF1 family MFS transporter